MAGAVVSDTTQTLPDGSTVETITYSDGSKSIQFTPAAGSPAANQQTIQQQAQTALAANRNDQAQDQTIITNAAAITGTTGTLSSTQLSNFVRQLAQAVSVLAGNDVNAKKELNALIRLALSQFDATN